MRGQLDVFGALAEVADVDLSRPPCRTFIGPRPPGHRTDSDTWIWSVCACGWRSREYREDHGAMAHTIEDHEHRDACALVAAYTAAQPARK